MADTEVKVRESTSAAGRFSRWAQRIVWIVAMPWVLFCAVDSLFKL
jgi:hypothetical protein